MTLTALRHLAVFFQICTSRTFNVFFNSLAVVNKSAVVSRSKSVHSIALVLHLILSLAVC